MKAAYSLIAISVFVLSAGFIYAGENFNQGNYNKIGMPRPADYYKPYVGPREKVADSPGMEFVKIGNTTVFVPEDMKIYEGEGRIILEETDPYMARKFKETQEHLEKIDAALEELKKEIEALKKK